MRQTMEARLPKTKCLRFVTLLRTNRTEPEMTLAAEGNIALARNFRDCQPKHN